MDRNDRNASLTEQVLAELREHPQQTSRSICSSINRLNDGQLKVKNISAILNRIYNSPLGPFMTRELKPGNGRCYRYRLVPETKDLSLDEIYRLTLAQDNFGPDQAVAKAPALEIYVTTPRLSFQASDRDQRKTLLAAHVRHELSLFKGQALEDSICKEIDALFDWLNTITLDEFISPEQVISTMKRNIIEAPVPREFTKFVKDCAKRIHDFLKRNDTQIDAIVPKAQYDKALKNIISLKKLRKEITARSVSGSIYAELISDLLYRTTKDFILTENILVRNIPMASSLIRFGQETLNRAIPKLEASIDKRLIDFIKNNIQNIMQQSEKLLNNRLNEAFLIELGQKIWHAASAQKISSVTEFIVSEQIESFTEVAEESWDYFRKSPLFDDILNKLVQTFFENYRHENLKNLLEGMGFTPEKATREALALIPPIVDKAIATGYLEKRLRERLASFYLPGEMHDRQ